MSSPRFQLLSAARLLTHQGGGDLLVPSGAVLWRLLGANNYELGRSAEVFDGLGSADAGVEDVLVHVAELVPSVDATPGTRTWRWLAALRGHAVAVSSRGFPSERACRYNLGHFLAVVPEAVEDGHPRWARPRP